jgi:cytochrome b
LSGTPKVRIWDLPVRLFHWAIVLLVPAMWWTAENEKTELHILLGQVMLGLLLFRILWGVLGSSTARFAGFVRGPGKILAYLRGAGAGIGHNPIGALSVLAMLAALAVQVGLGLFASDKDGLYQGPLSYHVSAETAETLTDRHETWFYVLLALIVLHLAAILYYRLVRRRDLIMPMVTGRGAAGDDGAAMIPAPWWRFPVAAALAAGATSGIVQYL